MQRDARVPLRESLFSVQTAPVGPWIAQFRGEHAGHLLRFVRIDMARHDFENRLAAFSESTPRLVTAPWILVRKASRVRSLLGSAAG
ncbi:hypothetical protein [Azorhizophilus paspali]|uniref:hypothetical protein n=1 Tax=Azorhizophilus paspali TaxID=69963 RepID=UPI003747A89C